MSQSIAILTPEQIEQIAAKAYTAGQAATVDDEIFTVAEAAKFLHLSADQVRQLADAGKIPCRDFGLGTARHYRFTKSALLAWTANKG